MLNKNILLAEDEPTISRLVRTYFERDNYTVYTASNGEEAIKIFTEVKIDLVCLAIMMPIMDGFEVTKIIRASSDVPIIIMTALQSEEDILKGYSLHVDDYITKPFNPKVLVAKVNNLMMRMDKENSLKMEYKIGELSFDFINSSVTFEGKPLELTKTEFKMLAFLAKNNNKVCSRELLLDEVWGLEVYVDDRIVDAYIKKLRKIIAPKKYIKTVFGTGYRFSIEEK
jgi:two-component system response regulator VanR